MTQTDNRLARIKVAHTTAARTKPEIASTAKTQARQSTGWGWSHKQYMATKGKRTRGSKAKASRQFKGAQKSAYDLEIERLQKS